jgi:GT2 family glycosyltransferase
VRGDVLAHERVVEELISALANVPSETLWVYGQVNLVGRGLSLMAGKKWADEWPNFFAYMTICHQGVLVRREVFAKLGAFSERYRIAGDFEFLLRLVKHGHYPQYLPLLISVMARRWPLRSSQKRDVNSP